jgi:hypothetical protein|tara:strand:- start:4470 stop:5630 length:1161 start_codon:yes stop_codon:yes gene_type:complete
MAGPLKSDIIQVNSGTDPVEFPQGITIDNKELSDPSLAVSIIDSTGFPDSADWVNGQLWYDSANSHMNIYTPDGWRTFAGGYAVPRDVGPNSGDRAIVFNASSGTGANYGNKIEYFDITSTGNAASFGIMTTANGQSGPHGAISNGTYCINAETRAPSTGYYELEYVVSATTGNAQDFGSLASLAYSGKSGVSDGASGYYTGSNQTTSQIETLNLATQSDASLDSYTSVRKQNGAAWATITGARGIWAGGTSSTTYSNEMFYLALPIVANSTDRGDLTVGRNYPVAGGNDDYMVIGGGWTGSASNVIDYTTMGTSGNAVDFGDLTVSRYAGCSTNTTRSCFMGGYNGSTRVNTIDYITIATPGNAYDFGDMTDGGNHARGTSGAAS